MSRLQARPYHWYCLFVAIILEVAGSTVMKLAQNWAFTHAAMAGLVLMWLAIGLSYYLLAVATTGLHFCVAYAFWEGLGLVLVSLSSIFILKEELSFKRVLGLVCVLLGAWLVHKGTGHGNAINPSSNKA